MPSTNDANKGTLEQLRVILRNHPTLTLHQFNAVVMFNQNNTQDFMDALFEMPDHLYIMWLARQEDADKDEEGQGEDLRILVKVKLVLTVTEIYTTGREANLTVKMLHQQLDAFRLRGVPAVAAVHNALEARAPTFD
ncbi:hypothetical protein DFH06DRAFT_1142900 [Mycena polygramma]|nr:hypothetical protein DFH06DRAFT_1142900 [Mycena polygramma]